MEMPLPSAHRGPDEPPRPVSEVVSPPLLLAPPACALPSVTDALERDNRGGGQWGWWMMEEERIHKGCY
eukprot:240958-Rhodomonas_salina.3